MYRHLVITGAALAALSLAACNKPATTDGAATPAEQAATPDANPAATIPTAADEAAAPDFVTKAANGDMFEVEAAKIALKRSTSSEVKAFAQEMIDAHTKSTADLKSALASSGLSIVPPATLADDLRGKLDDLNKADAKDFDKAYLDGQKDAHQSALNLFQRYAQDGDAATLKAFAAATAPVIQKHLDHAKSLRDGLK